MTQSMVRILRPTFNSQTRNGLHNVPKLTDYIEVPRLSLIGTRPILELLDMPTLAKLSHLQDQLKGVVRRKNG